MNGQKNKMNDKDLPIFGPAESQLIEQTTKDTYDALHAASVVNGVTMALAMCIGTMFGVMHFMRALGLKEYGKQLFFKVAKEVQKPAPTPEAPDGKPVQDA